MRRITPAKEREQWPTESDEQDYALSGVRRLIISDRDARVTIRECLERIEWLEKKLTANGLPIF